MPGLFRDAGTGKTGISPLWNSISGRLSGRIPSASFFVELTSIPQKMKEFYFASFLLLLRA